MKPISYDDFLKAANKALDWFGIASRQAATMKERFMLVRADHKLIRISFDDIIYIEGLKDYIRFFLVDGSKMMSLISLKTVESYLPYPEFLRVHRSYIIHVPQIKQIDRLRIFIGDIQIPISETYRDEVLNYLDLHTLT